MNKKIIVRGGYRQYEIIDFLKGFSILTIVVMHLIQGFIVALPGFIKTASSLGGTGVHIFIFCSGFGLYLSQLNNPKSYIEFIKTRFKKIYIPYIIIILICFCIPFMYTGEHRIIALLSHIFCFKMFMQEYEYSFLGPTWFISTIIQFYLIFIPLCALKKKMKTYSFAVMGLSISIIWWILVYSLGKSDIRVWNSFFLQYLWEFILGMCVADILFRKKDISVNVIILIISAVLGLAIEGILGIKGGSFKVFNDIFALIGYGSLVILLYHIRLFNKFILKLSRFSYEWFLVHKLVFTIIFRIKPDTLVLQLCLGLIAFAISILTAYIYSLFVKNFLNKKI